MASREEQETTITWTNVDPEIRIWTSRPSDLTEMRKRVESGQARQVASGEDWADFRVPTSGWSLRGFKRHVEMTEERKAAVVERFRAAREAATA